MNVSLFFIVIVMSLFSNFEFHRLFNRRACRHYHPCTGCKLSFLRHPSDWNQFGTCYRGKFFGFNRCPNRTIFSIIWHVCVYPYKLDDKRQDKGILNKDGTLTGTTTPCQSGPGCDHTNCGVTMQSLIVGGRPTSIEDWPWQVSLMDGRFHVCGGTLINQQWVLTAAHCVFGKDSYKLKVVLGVSTLYKLQVGKVSRPVAKIVINSKFTNGGSYPNDIAMLKLSSPVGDSEYVRPVCLPSIRDKFTPSDTCWITGWGETLQSSKSSVLNELQIHLTSLFECKKNWTIYANRNHICVGDGRIGPCRGDSGGPLVCLKNNRIVLAGISSFSNKLCKIHGFPAMYTAVSGFMNWIYHIIGNN